ncbi:MAG TPA: hypothetical protein VFE62_24255 [Gemmataceae bacterium]|nr:hypothetical protein [Gemmataceae bacterium]
MTNQWLRLWHDMPTDPKWIVIAEKSEQPIALVIAVYVHMLVNASMSPQRGSLHHWCDEDVAAALRTQPNAIERIRTQMNGKVLVGQKLIGWEARQPAREDGSAERARAWREKKKHSANATEHNRTQTNIDKDTEYHSNDASAKAALFKVCREYLGERKMSLVGKWVKEHGIEKVFAAVNAAQTAQVADPPAYINRVLRPPAWRDRPQNQMPSPAGG